jgi:hypothetical protein
MTILKKKPGSSGGILGWNTIEIISVIGKNILIAHEGGLDMTHVDDLEYFLTDYYNPKLGKPDKFRSCHHCRMEINLEGKESYNKAIQVRFINRSKEFNINEKRYLCSACYKKTKSDKRFSLLSKGK